VLKYLLEVIRCAKGMKDPATGCRPRVLREKQTLLYGILTSPENRDSSNCVLLRAETSHGELVKPVALLLSAHENRELHSPAKAPSTARIITQTTHGNVPQIKTYSNIIVAS
jgi:hypothetical protein